MDCKMSLVILDASGKLINIGPWDTAGGANPLPAGAVEADMEVITGDDGGKYVQDSSVYVTGPLGKVNGSALEERMREAAKEEARTLAAKGNLTDAFNKLLEII
jgi:hypothetical protein